MSTKTSNDSSSLSLQNTPTSFIATEEQIVKNDREIWEEIDREFAENRKILEDYKESKNPHPNHPPTKENQYLNECIFPLLNEAVLEMFTVLKNEQFFIGSESSSFNGINFIAEYLWNMNSRYPERRFMWTNIVDIIWNKQTEEMGAIEEESPITLFPELSEYKNNPPSCETPLLSHLC